MSLGRVACLACFCHPAAGVEGLLRSSSTAGLPGRSDLEVDMADGCWFAEMAARNLVPIMTRDGSVKLGVSEFLCSGSLGKLLGPEHEQTPHNPKKKSCSPLVYPVKAKSPAAGAGNLAATQAFSTRSGGA